MVTVKMLESTDAYVSDRRRCAHCQKAVKVLEVVVIIPVKGVASPIVHRRCLVPLLEAAPSDPGSFEEIRARIVATGDAFAGA